MVLDSNNPSFRYSEGIISQNYLFSKTRIEIPNEGISEIRTYMIGIASLEVAITAPISLYAVMSEDFFLEIGPN